MPKVSPDSTICLNDSAYFLPHPQNKSKYFICENGNAHEENCPGNLLFDPKLSFCWWPEDSVDSDEIVSDHFRSEIEAEFMIFISFAISDAKSISSHQNLLG